MGGPLMRTRDPLSLFSATGSRKYLCAKEVPRLLEAANKADPETREFCRLLTFTGCRISEALALTAERLDAETGRVVFFTLKRRQLAFRAVPVPPDLMRALCKLAARRPQGARLWPWCRQSAWRRVKKVMDRAGIVGAHAMPKGLRHGFGVANAEQNVSMATTRRWLGHSSLETTAIYQQASGREERAFAARLWRSWRAR
jgi:integrase/recombinase XerD